MIIATSYWMLGHYQSWLSALIFGKIHLEIYYRYPPWYEDMSRDLFFKTVHYKDSKCWDWSMTWVFIRPFEKRDVLCHGNVRPSVCPSVLPHFPYFSSTCFEISIWNLVYTFSRWHDMLSSSCITIGSLWPSLQPKVGQTHFFSIMAS